MQLQENNPETLKPPRRREHEQMSVALLDDILADNLHGITERDLSEEEIGRVKGMIVSGKGGAPAPPGKRWLYEVLGRTAAAAVHTWCLYIYTLILNSIIFKYNILITTFINLLYCYNIICIILLSSSFLILLINT